MEWEDVKVTKQQILRVENTFWTKQTVRVNPNLQVEYDFTFTQYESLGFFEEVTSECGSEVSIDILFQSHVSAECMYQTVPVYYMPHNPVVNQSCVTTKVRHVFDASAQGYNGVSLNDSVTSAGVCVRVRRAWHQSLRALLSRVFGSLPRLRLHVPVPRSVILWTFLSRARSFPRNAPRLPLLMSLLQRCFGSTAGAAILYVFPLVLTSGAHPQSVPVSLSVCLLSHWPSPSRNPAFQCQWRVFPGLPASWITLRAAKLFLWCWLVYW